MVVDDGDGVGVAAAAPGVVRLTAWEKFLGAPCQAGPSRGDGRAVYTELKAVQPGPIANRPSSPVSHVIVEPVASTSFGSSVLRGPSASSVGGIVAVPRVDVNFESVLRRGSEFAAPVAAWIGGDVSRNYGGGVSREKALVEQSYATRLAEVSEALNLGQYSGGDFRDLEIDPFTRRPRVVGDDREGKGGVESDSD